MRKVIFCIALLLGLPSFLSAQVTLSIYEADAVTPFDYRTITAGTKLKLVVASDSNDFWSGGLFLSGDNRNLAYLDGSGKDPNSRDWRYSHCQNAGPEALVTDWEDSRIQGFDLFSSDSNCVPGEWFAIDYIAVEPGEPNVGFYEYSVSWNEPNAFVIFHQVPITDFNTDGIVDLMDLSIFSGFWNRQDDPDAAGWQIADLDTDGTVGINDLVVFSEDWLWAAAVSGISEPNQSEPHPDPNLIYSIMDATGVHEITLNVGESVTLYVDMTSIDSNDLWAFEIEVDISDPNRGSIDNRAYDPNNPPGPGTARILAGPNRWTMFDRWGPGYQQEEGIYLSGISFNGAFEDGHLASFVYTCVGTGDVELNLVNEDSTSTTGEKLHPTLTGIVIHQYDLLEQQMMTSEMSTASALLVKEPAPKLTSEEMVQLLEDIWQQDEGIQDLIDPKDWDAFIKSVERSY